MPFTRKDLTDFIDFINFFKVREKYGAIYQNFVFIGLFCMWNLYHNSNYLLIPVKDLCILGITADIIITLLFFKFYQNKFSLVWALIHNLSIGLIVVCLFIWTNDNFSLKPTTTEVLPIENVDLRDNHQRHKRGLEPVLTINIKGRKYEITYHKSLTKSALKARQVSVVLKEGFWDYWVLTDIKLITNE